MERATCLRHVTSRGPRKRWPLPRSTAMRSQAASAPWKDRPGNLDKSFRAKDLLSRVVAGGSGPATATSDGLRRRHVSQGTDPTLRWTAGRRRVRLAPRKKVRTEQASSWLVPRGVSAPVWHRISRARESTFLFDCLSQPNGCSAGKAKRLLMRSGFLRHRAYTRCRSEVKPESRKKGSSNGAARSNSKQANRMRLEKNCLVPRLTAAIGFC